MTKKIILLALAAASMAAFALPATAMAAEEDDALHLINVPLNTTFPVDGVGAASLTGSFGSINCTSSSGTTKFTSTTTGTLEQTFKGCSGPTGTCTSPEQVSGTITTTELTFHLVTVLHEHNLEKVGPGILITPNDETNSFAHFSCPLFPNTTVTGNGLVGTIDQVCDEFKSEPEITFSSKSSGVQTHTTVGSKDLTTGKTQATPTTYGLTAFSTSASEDAAGKITLGTARTLECT